MSGLYLNADGSTVRGLAISRFSVYGIVVSGDGNTIEDNFIGTDITGATDQGNTVHGIHITATADSNTIDANLISGNDQSGIDIAGGANNVVIGNTIGLQLNGSTVLGNTNAGISISNGSTGTIIGGTSVAERNVISGNGSGIIITGATTTANTIAGNYIGLNAAGNAAVANASAAIQLDSGTTNNVIGGATTASRNVIAGASTDGIRIVNANGTQIHNNYIGTDATGLVDLGFQQEGIEIQAGTGTIIGGIGTGNLISGNGFAGIGIQGGSGHVVQGNLIGTNATGAAALANDSGGINIINTVTSVTIGGTTTGEGNVIAFNATTDGIAVSSTSTGISILGNSIHDNAGEGIDLGANGVTANDAGDGDGGANNQQNFPVLSSASSVGGNSYILGTLNSTASTMYRIEFFSSPTGDASGYGEGQTYLGFTTVTTSVLGLASFNTTLTGVTLTTGHAISATATVDLGGGSYGDTSEFGQSISATGNVSPTITSNGSGSTASINVAENTTAVATVTSSDPDGGTPAYSIVGGDDQALFSIGSGSGVLTFSSGRNREVATDFNSDHIYEVTVQVSDGNGGMDAQAISVTVTDVDEFDVGAVSDTNGAANSVNENATNGTSVGVTAAASDGDATTNAITYTLDDDAGGRFAINASSGVVTVANGSLLDYEAATSYDITVRATSQDTSFSTQTFTINIDPVNDNSPVITSDGGGATATINMVENAFFVTMITGTDADLPAETLTYSITGGADAAKFAIDGSTGALSFVTAPNYDSPTDAGGNNVYDVTVQVSDGTFSDIQSFAVQITNDVDPGLWLSNKGNVSTGSGTWTDGTVVRLSDPNLALGSGPTNGTFSHVFDIDSLAQDGNADINGIHFVRRSVTIGTANQIVVNAGDVLFTVASNEMFGGLSVTSKDLVLFRPVTPNDYSSGTFSRILTDPGGTGNSVRDFALVEMSLTVGGGIASR